MSATESTKIINIRKKNLNEIGYDNLEHWLRDNSHVYIGRDMTHYVKGAVGSKWANPFSVNKYGREKCLKMYRNYIMSDKKLLSELAAELSGKTLGCWCAPDPCHGDVLIEILNDME